MSHFIKIGLFSFTLFAFIVHNCKLNTPVVTAEDTIIQVESIATITPPDDNAFGESSEITRLILITHCGKCHQSSLETHKAGAIAIFDLDKNTHWHDALSEHHLPGITQRTQNKNSITEEQKEAIALFLELKEKQLNQ